MGKKGPVPVAPSRMGLIKQPAWVALIVVPLALRQIELAGAEDSLAEVPIAIECLP